MASASAAKKSDFNAIVGKLTFPSPSTDKGRGFLPPFIRAMSHLVYTMACVQSGREGKDKEFIDKNKEAVKNELKEAYAHYLGATVSDNFSSDAQTYLKTLGEAFKAASEQFDDWDDDTKLSNLRTLVNKGVGIAASLDRELIGIRNSDAGSNL